MGLGVLPANFTPIAPVRTTKATTVATIHLLICSSETGKLRGGVYEVWNAVKGKNRHTCVERVHVYPCWLSQSLYLVVRWQVRNAKRRGQEYVSTTEPTVIVLGVLLRMVSIWRAVSTGDTGEKSIIAKQKRKESTRKVFRLELVVTLYFQWLSPISKKPVFRSEIRRSCSAALLGRHVFSSSRSG